MQVDTRFTFRGKQWEAGMYSPGETSLDLAAGETQIGVDTEFEPRMIGEPCKPVLMQVAFPKNGIVHMVWWEYYEAYLSEIHRVNPDLIWAFFNAPADLQPMDYKNNFLWEGVFGEDHRVHDMMIRYSLYEMAIGVFFATQGLDAYTKKYLGEELPKDDEIRLSFRQDMELTQRHKEYGAKDPVATVELARAVDVQPLEQLKTTCSVALHEMGERGYPADREYLKKIHKRETDELHRNLDYLSIWGLWPTKILGEPTGMSGSQTELQKIMHAFEDQLGVKFPRTKASKKKGSTLDSISLSNEDAEMAFITAGFPVHPLVEHHKAFKHAEKMLSTYLREDMIREDERWHPRFSPIKANGRTGASGPPIQTYPQKGGHRGIFCADPGKIILAVDVCQAELCALAESCWSRFGHSKMRELINDGMDLHEWFGTEYIAKKMLQLTLDELTKDKIKELRGNSKPVNFGFPGGLGIGAFVAYAKNQWGKDFSLEFAKEAKAMWLEAFPECREHLNPVPDMEFWLRNIQRELRESHDLAIVPIYGSLEDYRLFLQEQDWKEDDINDLEFRTSAYQVTTFHGRTKRNCVYTAACNYEFSAMVADAMSYTLTEAERLGYPQINFVHDEIHFHLDRGPALQDQVKLCDDLVRDCTQAMIPDVTIRTEPALMSRWYKEAEPVWDDEGNLIEWTPEMAENN